MKKMMIKISKLLDNIQVIVRRNPFSIVLVLMLILLFLYFLNFKAGFSTKNSEWGAFGDFFNGVSAPFIGIIGVVLTFTIINNQTRESKQSEYKFIFQLLFSSFEQEIEKIRLNKGKKYFNGHHAISMANNHMKGIINFNIHNNQITDMEEVMRTSFTTLQRDCDYSFATYMKNFHNCLKMIDLQCNEEHKDTYIHLIKAGLSKSQMIFLLYNCLGKPEYSEFKERLERYGILQNIRNDVGVSQDVKNLYQWN